jgi:xanthine/CO dehydrogenase XdhC/CoxF family maturation factor
MTDELAAMADLAKRLVASGTPGTLSTLFSARGSTYRPLGSMMVSLPGMHAGGISGGCLEEYVARVGERATRSTSAVMLRFNTHPDSDDDVPILGCGGSIEVLVERLTPGHVVFLEQFASASGRDEGSMIACRVVRAGESLSVTREWLRPDRQLASGPDVLVQYVPPVTVADRRARFATSARFPHARAVLASDWADAVDAVVCSPRTAAVLMTHSLDDDARVLSLLSGRRLAYIGVLGPAHRLEWLLEQASALAGERDGHLLGNVHGPVGLDLGDRSAAGIAIAVAAEILARLNHRDAQPLHATRNARSVEARRGACVVA